MARSIVTIVGKSILALTLVMCSAAAAAAAETTPHAEKLPDVIP